MTPEFFCGSSNRSPNPHRLNVDEGADAVVGEFASVAAFFDAAEGQARVAFDHTAS